MYMAKYGAPEWFTSTLIGPAASTAVEGYKAFQPLLEGNAKPAGKFLVKQIPFNIGSVISGIIKNSEKE